MPSQSSPAFLFLFATAMLLASGPSTARACSDGGPGNALCSDGGAQWILCSAHSDCPEGQVCASNGACTCGESCGAEECDENGCHCCARPDAGAGCYQRFVCEGVDAGSEVDAGVAVDAGGSMDGGAMDGGSMDGGAEPAPSSGCSIGTGSPGARGVAGWALVVIGALALHRRRARADSLVGR